MVGEPDRRHVELSGPGRERRNPAGPIEDGVLGVDVKVDERRFGHGTPILDLAQDRIAWDEPRPVTPEVAGSSPVAPVYELRADRRLLFADGCRGWHQNGVMETLVETL